LRENLDPLNEHDDGELNAAIKAAGLSQNNHGPDSSAGGINIGTVTRKGASEEVQQFGLDTHVESSGSNFSQGQRQIIALARALVRRTKLLIMDEATSAIGMSFEFPFL
jgi:ABC-type multidrug transport system fused ATPase/permease subunit